MRGTRVEIDLDAIRCNAKALYRLTGVPLYAVVKADAYGHGAVPVARALAELPFVHALGVALVEEGIELRDAGLQAPILMMGACIGDAHPELIARGIVPMIGRLADLPHFAGFSVHLKLDTGMGRLGLAATELDHVGPARVVGVCTHLACADTDDPADPDSTTARQLRTFDVARQRWPQVLSVHAANSAAAIRFPAARYTHIRPGIALYGNGPPQLPTLRQAVRFASEVVALRDLRAGDSVSYGAVWRAERDANIAVIPVGYADGYPRNLTGRAEVLVGGRRCPLVGTVCMDMAMVDVTALGDAVAVGDETVLLGAQGEHCISTAEFSHWAGITEYEVTCGISKRVPRSYRSIAALKPDE